MRIGMRFSLNLWAMSPFLPNADLVKATGAALMVCLLGTFFKSSSICVSQEPPLVLADPSGMLPGAVSPPGGLRDTSGKPWSIATVGDDQKTVVAFLNFNCPVSNSVVPKLNAIASRFEKQGVTVVAVVCGSADTAEIQRHVRETEIVFRVVLDPDRRLAAFLKARVTPQVFLLDSNLALRYSGLVDNQYASRLVRRPEADSNYLLAAITAVLAGREVEIKETTPIGCSLEMTSKPVIDHGPVEFHRDIEPLLQKHCQRCHHPGDVAPFSLVTFDDAVQWGADIKSFTADRLMPPWPVTGGIPLQNDLALRPEEIERIGRWVDEGCPRGDPADAPPPLSFANQDDWQGARPPDIVLSMPGKVHLAAEGEDHYRTVVLPLNNPDELYVERIAFIPGNRKAIHHCMLFYDGTGLVLAAQQRLGNPLPKGTGDQDFGPGYDSGMGLGFVPDPTQRVRNPDNAGGQIMGWVPGAGPLVFPSGVRRVIPTDAAIAMQLHYTRTGKPEIDDSSRVGIWFTKKSPQLFSHGFMLDTDFRLIPKGDANFKTTGSREIMRDCHLWVIAPHMHRLGKEMRIWYQPPDSPDRELLLEIKNWDFNWQHRYLPKDPYPMKKGARLHVEAVFDNSVGNPRRRRGPERTVFLGEGTDDEMAFAIIGTIIDEPPKGKIEMIQYFEKLLEAKAFRIAYEALGKQ